MTDEQRRLIEAQRAANAVQPLGADGVTHQGSMPQRKRSDFYRGGTNDLLGGHDAGLLVHESCHWEKDPLVPYSGCACATCKR